MFKLHFHSSLYNKLNNDYQGFWHNHKYTIYFET